MACAKAQNKTKTKYNINFNKMKMVVLTRSLEHATLWMKKTESRKKIPTLLFSRNKQMLSSPIIIITTANIAVTISTMCLLRPS